MKLNSVQTLMTLNDARKPEIVHRVITKPKKSKIKFKTSHDQNVWAFKNGHSSWLMAQVATQTE